MILELKLEPVMVQYGKLAQYGPNSMDKNMFFCEIPNMFCSHFVKLLESLLIGISVLKLCFGRESSVL